MIRTSGRRPIRMSDSDVILFRMTFLRHREIGFDPIAGILTSQSLDSEPNTGRMSGFQHSISNISCFCFFSSCCCFCIVFIKNNLHASLTFFSTVGWVSRTGLLHIPSLSGYSCEYLKLIFFPLRLVI